MALPPKLRSDLVSSASEIDGATVYTVKDPIGGNYFRFREPEHWLIHQFDGRLTPDEIAARFRDKFNLNIMSADVAQFALVLDKLLFLENSRSEQALSQAGRAATQERSLWSRILYVQIRAFKPGRFLDWLSKISRPFSRPFWFVIQGALILTGLVLLVADLDAFAVNLSQFWNVGSLGLLLLSLFILVTLHEFGHAVVCRLYGGEVREIGFLLLYFQPGFYCDLSDAWLFPKKSQRLGVTLAGPYVQLMLLAGSVIVWRLSVPGMFLNDLAWMLVTVNWINFLFNFNPLIKLDGYFLLSDLVDIPNLRQKAFAYLGNVVQRRILGWPVESLVHDSRHRRIYILYGLTALVYSALLLGFVFSLVSAFLMAQVGPAGLVLLIGVLLFILRSALRSLARGAVTHLRYMKRLLKQPLKLAGYLVVSAGVLVVGLAVPMPHRVSGEVLVRPIAVFTVRLNEFGVLEKITRLGGESPETKTNILQLATTDMAALQVVPIVHDGQLVTAGDTIAAVTSNQITREIESGQAELERLRGELALLKAPPKKQEIDEAKARINAAKATLQQYKRERDRIKSLVENNLEARERLESSQSQVEIAEAEVTRWQSALNLLTAPPRAEEEEVVLRQIQKQEAQLAFLMEQSSAASITSPISGAASVSGRDGAIVTIAACDPVELLVPVSDFDLPRVTLGQSVQVKVRSFPNRTFAGTVVRLPKAADATTTTRETANPAANAAANATGIFPVTVLVENRDGLLCDGMSGYAKIETGKSSLVTLGFRKVYQNLRVEFWSWW
ncbi:MAG: site-2 protease family protein [Candidatus Zixiibacteriota bacterium]